MRFKPFLSSASALLAIALLAACATPADANLKSHASARQATTVAPSWVKDAVIYEVNTRQYTAEGTFDAFATNLPRLKALGVNVLWFMPIQPISVLNRKGTMGSPYSVADYKAVNPDLGTNQDFKDLVTAAHAQGFKVMLDWVPNHTGWDNAWITDHPDWYTHVDGEITQPPGTDWYDVADLNYDNQDMRAAMIDAMKYWVTTFDIDGYREDVAGGVPADFWSEAIYQVNQVKPLFWLAENGDDAELLNSGFHANYNWDLLGTMNKAKSGDTNEDTFFPSVSHIEGFYQNGTFPMNFITNHDENSWNGTEFERLGSAVKPMAAMYFTLPGMPLIYTGQEVGFNRRLQFFEKDQVDWAASPATAFYKGLIKLKKQNSALWAGSYGGSIGYFTGNNINVSHFYRLKGKNKVIALINTTKKTQTITVRFNKLAGTYYDYASGVKSKLGTKQTFTLKPWAFKLFSSVKIK